MMSRFFNAVVVFLLSFVLVTPTAFFIAPQKAHAQFAVPALDGGAFASVPTSANSFGAETLHTNPGSGNVAPAGGGGGGCLAGISGAIALVATEFGSSNFGTPHGGSPGEVAAAAGQCLTSTMQLIHMAIIEAATVSTAASNYALVINFFILEPLAFVLSGDLLKVMTQGVIAFVIGKANGTGLPQFVADIQRSMQTVTDVHTLAFLNQYMRSSKSPYHGSVIDALRKDYLNRSSLEGFWAANMDTLRKTSPNSLGFINGNWMLGGTAAWFALTTQSQNSPYSQFQDAQKQLAKMNGPGVGGSTGARITDMINSNGFTGWCGNADDIFGLGELPADPTAQANSESIVQAANDAYAAAYAGAFAHGGNPSDIAYDTAYNAAIANGRSESEAFAAAKAAKAAVGDISAEEYAKAKGKAAYDAKFAKVKSANAKNSVLGIAPGDPCTNADGTPGTIKTPGSVIVASLNKVLGGQQDNVVRMGNVGPQINQIMKNIADVVKTVDFAAKLLGGPGSGGLFGVNQTSGANQISPLRQYTSSPGNLGATSAGVAQNAGKFLSSGSDILNRVTQYEAAVNVIARAATTASTSVASLISYCTDQRQIASNTLSATGNSIDLANLVTFASTTARQITAAQNALTIRIAPVFSRVITASTTAAAARAMVQKIQLEINGGGPGIEYTVDLQTLQTMPPSSADLADAQQDAINSSAALSTSNPPGSLNVSGSSLTDQLGLISTNATALRSSCIAPAPMPVAEREPTP